MLDTARTSEKLDQLRESVKVIRFFFKQLTVGSDGVLSFVIYEHEIGIHESSLLIARVDLEQALAVRLALFIVTNCLVKASQGYHCFNVLLRLLEAVHVGLNSRTSITDALLIVLAEAVGDLRCHKALLVKLFIVGVTAHLNDGRLEGTRLNQGLPSDSVLLELPVWEHHVLLELALSVEHEVLHVADLHFKAIAHALEVLQGVVKDPSSFIESLKLLIELGKIVPQVKQAGILEDLGLVVLDSTRVVVGHDQGLADLSNEHSVLRLALKCPLVVDDGLLGLLDIHQSLSDKLEVLNTALGVKDFKVAAGIVVAILEFIEVDLCLFFLSLHKAAVGGGDLFEHVEGTLGVAHFESKV